MREFNKVSTTLWRSRKFRTLPNDTARMAYFYLLTCPHGNSAGCFDIHPMYGCADLGWAEEAYREAIDSLCKAGLIEFDKAENTVLILNWERFNEPTNPKHAIGLLDQLKQASSLDLRYKAFQAFREKIKAKTFDRDAALRKAIETFLKAYPEAIATETRPRPDQTETQTETRDEPRAPRPVAALKGDGPTASVSRLLETRLMRNTA